MLHHQRQTLQKYARQLGIAVKALLRGHSPLHRRLREYASYLPPNNINDPFLIGFFKIGMNWQTHNSVSNKISLWQIIRQRR
ncbi:hypothetical protein D3C76_1710690 [compost metagenome]